MRFGEMHIPTLRNDPSEAETPSHRLLVRGGFIRPLSAGIYSLLPLGVRVARRIEGILREEMNSLGGLEVELPVVQPSEIWRESGRWDSVGPELLRFEDRSGREMCLAMTHEEAIVHLVRGEIRSYRDLPVFLYQIQTKFRDEPRSRAGLIRVREFVMKDGYSFHRSAEDLDEFYPRVFDAYTRVFSRCGLDCVAVESDTGMMGGKCAHEFMAPSDHGEDTIIRCPACSYSANRQVAVFARPDAEEGPLESPEEVATPGARTIEEVSSFLGIDESRLMKAVFYYSSGTGLVFAVIRGDLELNETKLCNLLGVADLRPACDEEIEAVGAVPGYASPVGIRFGDEPGLARALVVADISVRDSINLVGGANREGFHKRGLNMGRDFEANITGDIAAAAEGLPCPSCQEPLEAFRGIEVGNIFKLGTRYSSSMNAVFSDEDGVDKPFVMGCYGIGVGRLMAAAVEANHDKDGIIWPASIAPFDLSIVLAARDSDAVETASRIHDELEASGIRVLLDDRDERPGVKFKDSDLVGIPLRLTVGRSFKDGLVELKERGAEKADLLSPERAVDLIRGAAR